MKDKPRDLKDHIINRSAVTEFVAFGLLAAVLAYTNYLFFFSRHGLDPAGLGTHESIYMQATILTYVTLVLCQFVNLLFVRTMGEIPLFSRYLWSNPKLLWAFGISLFCIANIVYNPWVQPYLSSYSLTVTDLLTAVGVAVIYTAIRLTHRSTKRHFSKPKHQLALG